MPCPCTSATWPPSPGRTGPFENHRRANLGCRTGTVRPRVLRPPAATVSARPFWVWREGELRHHPGHADDGLVFASPLRGDFEVSCELSLDDRRSMQIVYGGLLVQIAPDGRSYYLQQDEGPARSFSLEPPLDTRGDWHVYRLTVQGGRAEIAVDGRSIHAARLPGDADPWLWLRQLGRRQGGLRNLRITGNPTIPERLELARGPTLRGWSSSYFGETTGSPTAAWEQQGPEIHGHRATVAAGRHQESLLQYRRPLFEDGFIEYEFYHGSSGEAVHPALDRLVFILTPDGVRAHWLTDAAHDHTELTSDNRGRRASVPPRAATPRASCRCLESPSGSRSRAAERSCN